MNELRTEDRELTTADLAGQTAAPTHANGRDRELNREPETIEGELAPERMPAAGKMPATDHVPAEEGMRAGSKPMPLFTDAEMEEFRAQWSTLQTGFVDEPRRAVEDADKLVASVMQRLAESFANERSGLEKQWDRGDNVSTEDLRVALQRYRSFFGRLLNL
ncbi:MAG: hypothetical protein WB608_05965 [Terracidiphilus sp.]